MGKSVREKLTLPPKAEAGDGWMFSLGLKWKQRFSEKCQRAFVRFLVRLPQRETSLWWIFLSLSLWWPLFPLPVQAFSHLKLCGFYLCHRFAGVQVDIFVDVHSQV